MKPIVVLLTVLTLASAVASPASARHWRHHHCHWRHHHRVCW